MTVYLSTTSPGVWVQDNVTEVVWGVANRLVGDEGAGTEGKVITFHATYVFVTNNVAIYCTYMCAC